MDHKSFRSSNLEQFVKKYKLLFCLVDFSILSHSLYSYHPWLRNKSRKICYFLQFFLFLYPTKENSLFSTCILYKMYTLGLINQNLRDFVVIRFSYENRLNVTLHCSLYIVICNTLLFILRWLKIFKYALWEI